MLLFDDEVAILSGRMLGRWKVDDDNDDLGGIGKLAIVGDEVDVEVLEEMVSDLFFWAMRSSHPFWCSLSAVNRRASKSMAFRSAGVEGGKPSFGSNSRAPGALSDGYWL